MPTIDTHAHLWDINRPWMAWLRDEPFFARIARTFTPTDLADPLDRTGVTGVVLVQAAQDVAESVELLSLASATPWVLGVVAWTRLDSTAATCRDLATLSACGGAAALVGIRHYGTGTDDDPLMDGRITGPAEVLADRGLALDVHFPDPGGLPAVAALARRVPGLRIVVNHLGKPDPGRPMDHGGWAAGIASLAELPDVHVKFSGWATRLPRPDPAAVRPFVRHVLAHLGDERVQFASNWPVALMSGSYEETLAASHAAVDELDPAARERVFAGNAAQAYQLTQPLHHTTTKPR